MQSLLRLALGAALLCLAWLLLSASHAHAAEGTPGAGSHAPALAKAASALQRSGAPAAVAPKPLAVRHLRTVAKAPGPSVKHHSARPASGPAATVLKPVATSAAPLATTTTRAATTTVRATVRGVDSIAAERLPVVKQVVRPVVKPVVKQVVKRVVRPAVGQVLEPVIAVPSTLGVAAVPASDVVTDLAPRVVSGPRAAPASESPAAAHPHSGALARAATSRTAAPIFSALQGFDHIVQAQNGASAQVRPVTLEVAGEDPAPGDVPELPTQPAVPVPSVTTGQSATAAAEPATVGRNMTLVPSRRAVSAPGPDRAVSALLEGPGSRPD